MTVLGLETPTRRTPPASDPEPRSVVLWVGVTKDELGRLRGRLPSATRKLLECADIGLPQCLGPCGEFPLFLRRIRYDGALIGYGVEIARWQTILERPTTPSDWSGRISRARTILYRLRIPAQPQLTDRLA